MSRTLILSEQRITSLSHACGNESPTNESIFRDWTFIPREWEWVALYFVLNSLYSSLSHACGNEPSLCEFWLSDAMFYPTRVGMSRLDGSIPEAGYRLSRACGNESRQTRDIASTSWFIPRAWEWVAKCFLPDLFSIVYPTCVGMSRVYRLQKSVRNSLSHVSGSESLLMDVCMTRIQVYPTRVGMSRSKTFTIFLHGCLSHIGGNESLLNILCVQHLKFIPREWEWIDLLALDEQNELICPACVGMANIAH